MHHPAHHPASEFPRSAIGMSCAYGCCSLHSLKELRAVLEKALDCWTRDDLAEIKQQFNKPAAAVSELLQLTKSAHTKMSNCIATAKKDLDVERAKKERQNKPKKTGREKAGNALHDIGAAAATPAPVFIAGKPDAIIDHTKPFIATFTAETEIEMPGLGGDDGTIKVVPLAPDGALKKAVDAFSAKFEKSKKEKLWASHQQQQHPLADLRAQRPLDVSGHSIMNAIAGFLLGGEREVLDETAAAFGIQAGFSAACSEKDHTGSIRLSMSGARSMLFNSVECLGEVFPEQGGAQLRRDPALEEVVQLLSRVNIRGHQGFHEGCPCLCCYGVCWRCSVRSLRSCCESQLVSTPN